MNARTRRIRLVIAACLCVSSLLASACSPGDEATEPEKDAPSLSAESIFKDGYVNIEVAKGQPGFSTRSGQEYTYAGFDIGLLEFLADRMDFKKYPHDVPPGEREERLTHGDVELAVATYTITEARDVKIDFTAPYLKTYQGVLVRKDDNDIKKLADLDGRRVCSAEGTTSDPNAAQRKKDQRRLKNALGADAAIGLRKDYKTCVQELRKGNFEAVWTDKVLLEGFAETPPYSRDVKLVPGVTIENRQFYGIGIKHGHKDDCRRLNEALKEFLGRAWRETFRDHFPELVKKDPNFEQNYKPAEGEFNAYEAKSCGAK